MWYQQQDQPGRKIIHTIDQSDCMHVDEQENQDRYFDVVRVKYINLDNVKSLIFTKLIYNTSQICTHIVYKVNTGAGGNLKPFKIFKHFY